MSNIKETTKLKAGQLIALIVIAVLNILWVVCDRIAFARSFSLATVLTYVELAIAVFYAVCGYKKPHGNLMRYLLLLYAVADAGLLLTSVVNWPTYVNAVFLVKIILAVYMAGRLDRYTQNVVISAAALVCNGVISYYLIDMITGRGMPLTFASFFGCIGAVTVWLAIAASYLIRFKPHKEAGITDKN